MKEGRHSEAGKEGYQTAKAIDKDRKIAELRLALETTEMEWNVRFVKENMQTEALIQEKEEELRDMKDRNFQVRF